VPAQSPFADYIDVYIFRTGYLGISLVLGGSLNDTSSQSYLLRGTVPGNQLFEF
jgi:hypothetical protein